MMLQQISRRVSYGYWNLGIFILDATAVVYTGQAGSGELAPDPWGSSCHDD
jgi:hypothetical protein